MIAKIKMRNRSFGTGVEVSASNRVHMANALMLIELTWPSSLSMKSPSASFVLSPPDIPENRTNAAAVKAAKQMPKTNVF